MTTKAAEKKRASHPTGRRASSSARFESRAHGSLVTVVREVIRRLVALERADAREDALSLLMANWNHFMHESPLTEDLRPWQLLASDLAVALDALDAGAAARARAIADEIRSMIMILDRNPVEELALRPASRRVLEALRDLGGRAEASRVRERSGHSPTHLSNILKALRGHGLVRDEPVPSDQRRKQLVLTDRGRDEMVDRHVAKSTDESFRSTIHINRNAPASDTRYMAYAKSAEL